MLSYSVSLIDKINHHFTVLALSIRKNMLIILDELTEG